MTFLVRSDFCFVYLCPGQRDCWLVCCVSWIKDVLMRCTSDVVLFCSYSYLCLFCFVAGLWTLWRIAKRPCLAVFWCWRSFTVTAWRHLPEVISTTENKLTRLLIIHIVCVCVSSAIRSSPCSTASLVMSSWWRLAAHRPRCWTATDSTSWSV